QLRHDELDLKEVTGGNRLYARILNTAGHAPGIVCVGSICTLVAIVGGYFNFGKGGEFFTAVEPNQTRVEVFARGKFSPEDIREIVLDVQSRVSNVGYYKSMVTQSGAGQSLGGGQGAAPDLVGTIFIEFTDRRTRDVNGFEIENLYREAIQDIPGVTAEISSIEAGPPVGKQLQIELYGEDLDALI